MNPTGLSFIDIPIELKFTPLPASVMLIDTDVVVLFVYEIFTGFSSFANGGLVSEDNAPEATIAKGCGPRGIFAPFIVMVYNPIAGDVISTCSTLFMLSPSFPI